MPVLRRIHHGNQPASTGGGGGPTPALVAWGPDWGGTDGDRYAVSTVTSLPSLGLSATHGVGVDPNFPFLAEVFIPKSVGVSQGLVFGPGFSEGTGVAGRNTANAIVYNAQSVGANNALAALEYIWETAGTFTLAAPFTGNYRCDAWGGGGGAGGGGLTGAGGGGAGAQFARTDAVAFTSGNNIRVVVAATAAGGAGNALGTGASGTVGNDSYVSNTAAAPTSTTQGCLAKGGAFGTGGTTLGNGTGGSGSTTNGIGNTVRAGGNGVVGGGGGAGDAANGGAATANVGGSGGSAGGGAGGAGNPGVVGNQAGGGGGGGAGVGGNGAAGAIGRCRVRYTF